MRVSTCWLIGLLLTLVSAWTAQDREIFTLRDAVAKDVGADKTFYDWLGVDPKANDREIARAYRKMSQRLHPDKNPGKKATERFARLGLVVKVLRSDGRDRYDFFLKKGFPRWKGTDYYYQRFRPGLGSVLVFLYLLIGFAHYGFMKLTANQHRRHMTMIIDEAKSAAWGGGLPTTQRKVGLENGKMFMVYPGGKVCLLNDEDGSEWELNLDEIHDPTLKDTTLYKWPLWAYNKVTGKGAAPAQSAGEAEEDDKPKKLKPKPATRVGAARMAAKRKKN